MSVRAAGAAALAAALWLGAVAGGGQTRSARDLREDAYRANNLGVALLEQFKFDEAAAAFREALRLDATLGIAHLNLSLALMQVPDLAAARTEAAEADRLMPQTPQPPYVLGLIARNENRDDEAVAMFERVRRIDPRDVGTAINLAQMDIQTRQYAEAAALLRPAVADEPFNITAAYNLGVALSRSGNQRDEGQQMMERSQALRATGYGTTLSNSYLEQGRYAEALASTGAEPELIDAATPAVTYSLAPVRAGDASTAAVPASPFGRELTEAEFAGDGARRLAASLGGGLTVLDVDHDGDLDVFVADASGQHLLRNDGGRFTDITADARLADVPAGSVPIGCIAGDFDNDGVADLFVLRYGTSSLYRNDGSGHFADVTAASGLRPFPFLPGAAAFVDVDHDGDVDLVVAGLADLDASRARGRDRALVFPRDFAPAPVVLLRNNGNGTFADITRDAHIDVSGHALAIVPTDYDNRRDIDLLIVGREGTPVLLKNMRDGTFSNVAADVGLSALAPPDAGAQSSVAAADVNKDDYPDFYFGRADGPGVIAVSDGRGRFTATPAPDSTRGSFISQFVDYDDDGLLDLLTWSLDGPHLARNVGRSWVDVTGQVFGSTRPGAASARAFAIADLDRDGREDLVARTANGAIESWRPSATPNRSVRVQLQGKVSNRSALGSKVQIRAGSLSQRLELSASTPAVAPADLVFGIGPRAGADVVRVLWPSGILQAEVAASSGAGATPVALPASVDIEELNRKPSSCPFLYTWNGERFEFVTDFMGGGEMGYWEGPGAFNHPDPIEFVRIRDDQLQARDGRYELRVTNELEEALYLDRVQLIAIEHPADVEVFPNEGMTEPPKPFRLFAVKGQRAPAAVTDDHGHDVAARVAAIDREWPDDFALGAIRGYAAPHHVEIDLGAVPPRPVLLLTGWTDYAFSSDNVAATQAGLSLSPPSLHVQNAGGAWRTAIADVGIPVGRPQTLVVDLASVLGPHEHVVRLVTNMRIYWDRILVGSAVASDALPRTPLSLTDANLRERGFSAEVRPDGREPAGYDYARVTLASPWKTMAGRYTRVGDVRPLLARSDDMFVIGKPGDEVALAFDVPKRALPRGSRRTFLLLADGFSKEMDINSASPDRTGPLPFHRMTRYPYGPHEHYPDTPAHEQYRAQYNTRVVGRSLPPIGGAR